MEENTDLALINTFRKSVHLTEEKFFPFKGQGRILGILRRHEGCISQRELTEITGIRSSSITELTQKLCSYGLIRKETDGKDRRNTILQLTDKGWQEAAMLRDESIRLSQEAFKVLSAEEKEELLTLLGRLNEYWKGCL